MNEPEIPEVQRAVPQLRDLLVAMRPDWPDVLGVIKNAKDIGMTWEQTCVGLVRLAVDPEGRPSELIPHYRDPAKRRRNAEAAIRGAELAREELARLHHTREDTP